MVSLVLLGVLFVGFDWSTVSGYTKRLGFGTAVLLVAGFAVQLVMVSKSTYTLPDGTNKQTDSKSETLVTQLELGSLDPGIFEIPPGFKHVQHI